MSENYIVYHLHDDTSNVNGYADSCSDFKEYIKLAKKQEMKAIAFSNHGGIFDWIKKKQECDKAGIKYIHGVELYLCHKLEDNDRGGHIGLYARNWDGVLELNTLMSNATSKGDLEDNTDRHMYHNPRISLSELISTSENIIFTSACLASPLNRWASETNENKEALNILIKWMTENKHRCFLEIQYHNAQNQIRYNQKLHLISKKTGIPLIAGTDTHSSSRYKAECRKILQIYKKSFYGEEDEFDLVWKTYDELVEAFKTQSSLSSDIYMQAIENTNIFADMIEDFTLDKTFKYPTLYGDNVSEQWKNLIYKSLEDKKNIGALDLTNHTINDYKLRIKEEFIVMSKLGMESFMIFMSELLNWCKGNNIPYGTGRGSVCGSMIAYITDITDVDPLVWKTVFSRFCNEDRVSLGDIDVDFASEDREKVYEYIIQRFTPEKTAYIAAFSTLQDRGCIDVLAGGLGYSDLDKVKNIKNQFDEYLKKYEKIIQEEVNIEDLVEEGILDSFAVNFDNHKIYMGRINNKEAKKKAERFKQLYTTLIDDNQDLFYYLKGLKGTIVAKGTHPSGMIGSPITLADNIGLFYKDGDRNMPVSVCSMKAVDSLNYVKFDILGLKTVGIIKDACEYAGIPYPKSYELNWDDGEVWDNMITSQEGVFQFEGDYAFELLKDFNPHTINHMSMVNAALRPSGKSYRDRMIAGEFNKNPSEEIDKLLEDNNGYLIFQEDSIKFLTDVCDFSGSLADTTRRAIGKKDEDLLKQQLPLIIEGYCKHSSKPKEVAEEEAKQFVQIISDSSEYQFGFNHSTAYSMNGYECVYLRTYYTIEFVAAYLNRAEDKKDTNNGINLAKRCNISIYPIKFGKSLSRYTIDKDNNAIYKGIQSIKYCNSKIADELMELSHNKYNSFIDLLEGINSKTSVDARQLKILIGLNFFSDFGKNEYLLNVTEVYNSLYNRKQINKKDLESLGITEYLIKKYSNRETEKLYKELDTKGLVKELCSKIPNKSMSIIEHIKFEIEYLEYITYTNPKASEKYYIVLNFKTYDNPTTPYLLLRNIKTGDETRVRITKGNMFKQSPFGEYSVLKIYSFDERFKRKKIGEEWIITDETQKILSDYEVIKD
ncbi:MAG TPA: DNA polymerase III subunit alpha [Clostridiales bacterium]|nr:DNA polymerase III subunit alpha [Clostridiales bacterium]